jgi:hypothetical protein
MSYCESFFNVWIISLDWKRLGEWQVEPICLAITWLSPEQQAAVESTLAQIFELACDEGWEAILEAAIYSIENDLAGALPADASPYERAMWTWLHRPRLFEQALVNRRIDGLTRWHKRTGLPILTPRITPASVRELSVGLSQCLQREEGRGHKCTVEYFRRGDGTDYFVASPDDFVQTITTHDDQGNLIPRPLRQTFEIVFALRADEGSLELFAKVAPAVKPKLECVFGQIILGADLGEKDYRRPFDLNRLKDRYFCLETDPADRVCAKISRLRLDVPRYGWLTVEPKGQHFGGDIFEVIDDCLNDHVVRWEHVNISMATFRFEFNQAQKRNSTLTLDVTYPDRCAIRSRRPELIDLSRKYLRRWRIANV